MFSRAFLFLLVVGLSACVLKAPEQVQTNVIVVLPSPVEITNEVTILQPLVLTQSGKQVLAVDVTNHDLSLNGRIYLTNLVNESLVQPVFRLAGYFDASLLPYLEDFKVIANSNRFYPVLVQSNSWEVTLFDETNAYLPIELDTSFSVGEYKTLINFRVTNLPFVTIASYPSLTNISNLVWHGTASIADIDGDEIVQAFVSVVNEAGDTSSFACQLSNIEAWTNGVLNYYWETSIPLDYGDNWISGYVLSSSGCSNSISNTKITRSLFNIDGVEDALWSQSVLGGVSSNTTYAGYQLGELRITNNAKNLFLFVQIVQLAPLDSDYNGPRLAVHIDSISNAGLDYDAWGGSFVFTNDHFPDVQLQCRITKSGGQAVYIADTNWVNVANNWGDLGMNGVKMGVQTNGGFEFSVPLDLINLQAGQKIRVMATLSGLDGDNGNKQVFDVVPETPNNETASNENDFDATLSDFSADYTIAN